jgi:DNA mismatch endonuclease, patch repair protein
VADVFSSKKRSDVMSRIRSHGNKDTELSLIRFFRKHRILYWRRHWPLIGKPDFVFPSRRLVVFVDGCFWHGCLRHLRSPRSNRQYWQEKIFRNKTRDRKVSRALRAKGWHVLRIWEHELARKNEVRLLGRIRRMLK